METASAEQKVKSARSGKQPTALIAGGAGFLGSYLCEALVAQNFNVLCVDNFSSSSKQNIEGLFSYNNFAFWEEDITRPGFTVAPNVVLDYVFDLVSAEEHLSANTVSLQTLLVNSAGTKNLLDLAKAKAAKFILVSSTEVFHAALSQTSLINYFGDTGQSQALSFGEAKRFAETMTAEYFKLFKVPSVIVRIKDPYGPRMDLGAGNLLASLVGQALNKGKIEIIGDGLRVANPIFVSDVVFGIVKAALTAEPGEIFNLINPEKYTERSIAEHLQRSVGKIEIHFKNKEVINLNDFPLSMGTTQDRLNWVPKVSLDEGLSSTVNFFVSKNTLAEKPDKLPELKDAILAAKLPAVPKKDLLRKIIFAGACALLFWTIVLPSATLGVNFQLANRDLNQAFEQATTGNADQAYVKAQKAESYYKKGQDSLENVGWLVELARIKVAGKNAQDYLFLGEIISKTLSNYSRSQDLVIKASLSDSQDETVDLLVSAEDVLEEARRNLNIADAVQLDAQELPAPLKDNYAKLNEVRETLSQLIYDLENQIREFI